MELNLNHFDPSKPLLLGFSGGADSLALFAHLLESAYSFAVAHVDHGWREESEREAQELKEFVEKQGIVFHHIRLGHVKGNLEDACRQQRMAFFQELCADFGYQAVVLAHHADDQAETVCKRIFEGASLSQLGGMQEVTLHEGLPLWRPLLRFRKQEILNWLKKRGLIPIDDPTNRDTRFLRARMRAVLLPDLTDVFGKEITPSLEVLGRESKELRAYLDKKVAPFLEKLQSGALGHYLDLTEKIPAEDFELKHLIRCVFWQLGCSLPRALIKQIVRDLRKKCANSQASFAKRKIYVDRGRLFILRPLAEEVKWEISQKSVREKCDKTGWQNVWKGEVEVVLPVGNYQLEPVRLGANYPRSNAISKWWTAKKVPAFLRSLIPVVWKDGEIFFEFLASEPKFASSKEQISVRLIVT